MRLSLLLAAFLCMALPCAAMASSKDELEKTKQEMADSKANQEKIAKDKEALEQDLAQLQRQLVKLAASARDAEAAMAKARGKLATIEKELKEKKAALAGQEKTLEVLIQASLKLAKMPPEALIVLPGDEEAMVASRALKMTSESIRTQMTEIRKQTDALERLKKEAAEQEEVFSAKQKALAKEQEELSASMADKQKLEKELGLKWKEEEERVAALAKKAESLQSLLRDIRRTEKSPARKAPRGKVKVTKGKLGMPVTGEVVQRFGEAGKHEDTAKGVVVLASAKRAQVVAPMDGEVIFAGPFLDYGKLVILKHSDDFHTLLAGLGSIDADVGEFLLEGEPIGAMGSSEAGRKLYIELRKDNQPVDPAPWIKGLK